MSDSSDHNKDTEENWGLGDWVGPDDPDALGAPVSPDTQAPAPASPDTRSPDSGSPDSASPVTAPSDTGTTSATPDPASPAKESVPGGEPPGSPAVTKAPVVPQVAAATGLHGPDPARLCDNLALLLKARAVYPATHPRVTGPAAELSAELALWIQAPNWFRVRIRGDELVVGAIQIEISNPLVGWMRDRFKESGLAGIEFGPKVDPASVVEFAAVLGSCNVRAGRSFVDVWPDNHAKIRPLDLVFAGANEEVGPTDAQDTSGTAAQDVWKLDIVRQLAESQEVRESIETIQFQCSMAQDQNEEIVAVDLVTNIVDLLPMEVVSDTDRLGEIVARALDDVKMAVAKLVRDGGEVLDADLMRSALAVAKKYFGKSATSQSDSKELPTGRPEDDRITSDLQEFLCEFDELPPSDGLSSISADSTAASDPEMAAELCGIYLHVLRASERSESKAALATVLPKALADLQSDWYPVLDSYLQLTGELDPYAGQRVEMLSFLERVGCGQLLRERGYLSMELMTQTFPLAVPVFCRVFGNTPQGCEALRKALQGVSLSRLAIGAKTLAATGEMQDPRVHEPLIALGGARALPFVSELVELDTPESRTAAATYLRAQELPSVEGAALRGVEPPSYLPASYLEDLCRVVADRATHDGRARLHSGQLMRKFVAERGPSLPLDRYLSAIAALRHLPGVETHGLLQRIARQGRFTQLQSSARAVRRQAREVLSRMKKAQL